MWETREIFVGRPSAGTEHFTIVLPPPNANADLHLGHAMYVYEDVMIRYHKLLGKDVLWLAGADHAGIETQFVYEKQLKKQGKSRFDFDREQLFDDIWQFVMANRGRMEEQLKRLGFGLDWTKKKFTMDPDIVQVVWRTFARLHQDGMVYRAKRLVNYCTSCGTSFSDLEVADKEVDGSLYFVKYPLDAESGEIIVATTRPETMFGDVAIMVHPDDARYRSYIGKKVRLPLTDRVIPVIADAYVDPKFGTGAVKVTPAHDPNDAEVGIRHGLHAPQVIDFGGKMYGTQVVDGMYWTKARKAVIAQLAEGGFLQKEKSHHMTVGTCYRCGTVLQPLPKEQWFIKVAPLRERAMRALESGEIKIHPKRFHKHLMRILEHFIDWNISRQIVWGIRIPAFMHVISGAWKVEPDPAKQKELLASGEYVQDEDTFDTWFSSGQWPFATLQTWGEDVFSRYYPTSVMETGHDILRAWVARMMMLGLYMTDAVPFRDVFLHGMVRDTQGQKMSKSKGNVINPLDMVDKYGADALRAALVFGTKEGGDVVLGEDKIKAMRNFANKIWNIARFLHLNKSEHANSDTRTGSPLTTDGKKIVAALRKEIAACEKQYHLHMKRFEFAKAFDLVYACIWHRFADYYVEELKDAVQHGSMDASHALEDAFMRLIRLAHPYVPFVTEAVYRELAQTTESLLETAQQA